MEEERFLIDSNIVIYYLDNNFPKSEEEKLDTIFNHSFILSTVSKIEILGWHKITEEDVIKIGKFISAATVIYVDENIEQKSIELKRKYNIETPDCMIGASAIVNNLTLVTRNENDFKKVKELKIYNPFKTL